MQVRVFGGGWSRVYLSCNGEIMRGSLGKGVDGWGAVVKGQKECRHGAEEAEWSSDMEKR